MALSDRDYIRSDRPASMYGDPRAGPGRGRANMLSVNTWLIIINVAVFVLGGTFFRKPVLMPLGDVAMIQGHGKAELEDARELNAWFPDETNPAIVHRSLVKPRVDERGDPIRTLTHGELAFEEIARKRFIRLPLLDAWGHFSTGKVFTELQIWRFITFQFLHANVTHLMLNMLGLWFIGGMVEQRLGGRKYAAFYLTCGAAGALMYLLLNLAGYALSQWNPGVAVRIPGILVSDPYTPLVGASAGVFGVLLAAAYIAPKEIVYVLFVLPMRLRTAVYIFVLVALMNLLSGSRNAGGEAAHIGGAIAGYYLIRRVHVLRDILHIFYLDNEGSKRGPQPPGSRFKREHRSRSGQAMFRPSEAAREQEEIDRILDKVRSEGIQSLTAAEKRFLHEASRPMRGP